MEKYESAKIALKTMVSCINQKIYKNAMWEQNMEKIFGKYENIWKRRNYLKTDGFLHKSKNMKKICDKYGKIYVIGVVF